MKSNSREIKKGSDDEIDLRETTLLLPAFYIRISSLT